MAGCPHNQGSCQRRGRQSLCCRSGQNDHAILQAAVEMKVVPSPPTQSWCHCRSARVVLIDAGAAGAAGRLPLLADGAAVGDAGNFAGPELDALRVAHLPMPKSEIELPKLRRHASRPRRCGGLVCADAPDAIPMRATNDPRNVFMSRILTIPTEDRQGGDRLTSSLLPLLSTFKQVLDRSYLFPERRRTASDSYGEDDGDHVGIR
jgi:hypothetical protein